MTYLPITCPGCRRRQAEFDSQTGCIRMAEPGPIAFFGALFNCKCGRRFRFNGEVAVKKLRRAKIKFVNVEIVVAKT